MFAAGVAPDPNRVQSDVTADANRLGDGSKCQIDEAEGGVEEELQLEDAVDSFGQAFLTLCTGPAQTVAIMRLTFDASALLSGPPQRGSGKFNKTYRPRDFRCVDPPRHRPSAARTETPSRPIRCYWILASTTPGRWVLLP